MNRPSIASFIDRAADEAGVPREVILGDSRCRKVAWPRMRAMNAAWQAGWSMPQIARHFNRDHTTVLYAIRRCEAGEI